MRRVSIKELISLNTYWVGLSFMWNSLHVILLPAILLNYVPDERKNTALGLMTFVGLLVAAVVQPVSGAISDRWRSRFGRRRPLITLGTILDLLFLGVMALAGGLPALAVAYFGLQVTSNIAHGPVQGLMHDRVPPEKMGLASGVKNLFDMGGLVISSLAMGNLFSPEQPASSIGLIAAVLLGGAAVTLFGVREVSTASGDECSRKPESIRASLHVDLSEHGAYWRLIGSRFLFLVGVYGIQAFAQYYIRDTLQTENPIKLTGDLMAAIALSLITFSVVAGYLCDRFGRKPMHLLAAILVSVGSVLMLFAHTPGAVLVFGSVIGAGIGVFISANWALANDLAPTGEAGKFLGLTNLATAGAGALSRLNGPIIDALNSFRPGANLGYAALFTGAALLALASLVVLRRIPDKAVRHKSEIAVES